MYCDAAVNWKINQLHNLEQLSRNLLFQKLIVFNNDYRVNRDGNLLKTGGLYAYFVTRNWKHF